MSENPEIVEARKELEILKQKEKELEERLRSTEFDKNSQSNNKRSRKQKNRPSIPGQMLENGQNNFENFFYRETSSHNYNELANSIYVKDTTTHHDSDNDSSDGILRSHPRVNRENTERLINLSDDEDSEIMQVFVNDQDDSKQEADLLNSFEYFDGITDIHEESENEDIRELTGGNAAELGFHDEEELVDIQGRLNLFSDVTVESNVNHKHIHQEEDEDLKSSEEDEILEEYPQEKQFMIQTEIEENLKREHDLHFQRRSLENIDQVSETDSEYENYPVKPLEDTRDKIMREIEEAKLREIELHAKYTEEGVEQLGTYDYDEESVMVDNEDIHNPSDVMALEIQNLKEREQELRTSHYGHGNSYSPADDNSQNMSDNDGQEENKKKIIDPRTRIEQEMWLQQEREVEINRLHRSLSNDNLLLNDSDREDNADDNEIEKLDIRATIYQEMEDLKLREQEIHGSAGQIFDTEYDIINTNVIEKEEGGGLLDLRDKIYQEMDELQEREKELRKHYNYRFNETQSFEMISIDQEEQFNDSRTAKNVTVTDKIKFGSKENFLTFFEPDGQEKNIEMKSKQKQKPHKIKIPGAFMSAEHDVVGPDKYTKQNEQIRVQLNKEKHLPTMKQSPGRTVRDIHQTDFAFKADDASHQNLHHEKQDDDYVFHQKNSKHVELEINKNHSEDDPTKEPYFHDEMKPMKTSKKRQVFRRKSLQNIPTKGLLSQDVKERKSSKGDEKRAKQTTPTQRRLNIHPIAAKWEKKGEEERQKKLEIENELQKRKDERIKHLEEKAEKERNIRLLQEEEERAKEKKDEQLRRLKLKQQDFNKLWTLKKESDHEEYKPDNFEQLPPKRKQQQHASTMKTRKESQPLGGSVGIMTKIKKWEKKISKTSNKE